MVFRDDGVEDEIIHAEEKNDSNKPGSLIVKVLNEVTTRQGIRYEVKPNSIVLQSTAFSIFVHDIPMLFNFCNQANFSQNEMIVCREL